jgi:uncharacterized membrane protein YoaK (UPF0700 family)
VASLACVDDFRLATVYKDAGCASPTGEPVPTDVRQPDAALSFGLAFVGGYADAASFVLAKAFTGAVTGNFVLGAIAVAAHKWRAMLGPLSAILTFLVGFLLATIIARPPQVRPSWPLLPTVMGMEVILIVAASLALASDVAHGVAIFVIFVSLSLGLQNGAFRRVGGSTVHTTYITGIIVRIISTEAEKYTSNVVPAPAKAPEPKIGLLSGVWIAFVFGAGTGAAMVLHFKALGMLGGAVVLVCLILQNSMASRAK